MAYVYLYIKAIKVGYSIFKVWLVVEIEVRYLKSSISL